jgi:hypothetical protein
MKYSQELKDAMLELVERYGVTLSEVPDRFREKLLLALGEKFKPEIERVFKPLELGLLRNVRVCATHKISFEKLNETRNLFFTLENYSREEVIENMQLWLDIFKVTTEVEAENLEEVEFKIVENDHETIQDVEPIVDNISFADTHDFEKVINQFDTDVPVDEPQVEDYDGNFSDNSFETVCDFSISEAESSFNDSLEDTSQSINQILCKTTGHAPPSMTSGKKNAASKKNRQVKTESNTRPAPEKPALYQPQKEVGNEYTIDNAYKAMRTGDHGQASRIMMELARNGSTRAQFHLGEFYLQGTGIEKSVDKAKYWLRKAAAKGSVSAEEKLKELENQENSGGCCSCALVFFVILVVFKLLGSLF